MDRHSAPTSDITNQCLQVFPLNNAALIVKDAPETKIPLLPTPEMREQWGLQVVTVSQPRPGKALVCSAQGECWFVSAPDPGPDTAP